MRRGWLLLAFVGALCFSAPSVLPQTKAKGGKVITAKEIFDEMVREMTARRAKELWDKRRHAANPYDMLEVKIEDWLATEEGRFAHSIKIPNPLPAESGYKPGMTQQEYFELLCKNEAGEFIFKTADNVDGLYQIRPRRIYSHGEWQHLYALEDPYGYWPGEWEHVGATLVNELLYSYFEIHPSAWRKYTADYRGLFDASLFIPPPANSSIARYSGNRRASSRTMKVEYDTKHRARYGVTWRGIRRPMDREMGIAGGELIVLDLQTMEVMGVRRGYNVWNRSWSGRVCPRYGYSGGQDRGTYFTAWFVAKVARPAGWQEYFAIEEKGRRVVGSPGDKRY